MAQTSDINKADRTWEIPDFPGTVLIDNINACNLKCSMCDHVNMKKYRKVERMDMALYKKIIREIAAEKPTARVWEIFFGDPFLCRDMAARVGYAKDKGLTDVVLNSNGQMMNRKRALPLIEAGLDAMYVGIDSTTPETYEKIRIGGKLHKAVNNVLGYRDLLASHGKPGQKLFVQFVVSDVNEQEVEDFKAFWSAEGVNVKIRPKVSWAGLVDAPNLQDNSRVERRPCYWLMQTMNICADGRVALCSVDVHCRVDCGNVRDASIKTLWREGRLRDCRAMHTQGRFEELPSMCLRCSDWQSAYAEYVTV